MVLPRRLIEAVEMTLATECGGATNTLADFAGGDGSIGIFLVDACPEAVDHAIEAGLHSIGDVWLSPNYLFPGSGWVMAWNGLVHYMVTRKYQSGELTINIKVHALAGAYAW